MSKKPFEKFINPGLKGAKKKEVIRQQKRKLKEEARQRGEEFRRKEAEKFQAVGTKYGNTPEQKNKQQPATNTRPGAKNPKSGSRDANTETTRSEFNQPAATAEMPLNKFIAHAGICGRREAAGFVKEGKVSVNGDIIYEPGFKVRGNEDIKVNGKKIFSQKNLVYLLLNKPKDYLTTLKDPEGRKTVMDLIKAATKERVYPVGRLDRNTTGVLLLTNDGELAQKLTHPSFEVKKIYEVKLDKPVAKTDIESILSGITLEDGFIKADAVSYVDQKDKSLVGIEIHSGRNRIVRRIFEHLGYDVRNLDRVMFANLTKKNVDRGKWRYLNEKEIRLLKFMNQSFVRAKKERDEQEDRAVEEVLRGDKVKETKRSFKPADAAKRTKGTAPAATSAFKTKSPGEGEKKPRKRVYKNEITTDKPARKTGTSFSDKRTTAKKTGSGFGAGKGTSTGRSSAPAKRSPGRKRP